ncbi:uncharacterized protein [Lepeophtheirus salmonis]|uniref:uncharacterized protein n=1 Tax=Lepeophtheirus salmonis TaxID=72036 RepID=UPI001AE22DCD|nr:uncharacterized protein LOC121120438 [Lepeophtheirus salmonis]
MALDRFILYFPYILLGIGFLLIGIERMFTRIFKADRKVDLFYSLIAKEALENPYEEGEELIEESKDCIEVLYSFRKSNNFFKSYLYRTIVELVVAIFLFALLIVYGVASLRKGDIVYCNVHGIYYECAGIYPQFYGVVLGTVLFILIGYMLCTSYNLVWLLIPYFGKMSFMMKSLKNFGSTDIHELYYNNRDLALMLDLLAENSGLAPSLRILGLFDKDFRSTIEPINVLVERLSGAGGDLEIRVKFEEAVNARKLMNNSKLIPNILYTVETKPHTKSSAIETFSSATEQSIHPRKLMIDSEESGSEMQNIQGINYTSVIRDVEPKQAYTICISTIINGKTVARVLQGLKAAEEVEKEIDEKSKINMPEINAFHGR